MIGPFTTLEVILILGGVALVALLFGWLLCEVLRVTPLKDRQTLLLTQLRSSNGLLSVDQLVAERQYEVLEILQPLAPTGMIEVVWLRVAAPKDNPSPEFLVMVQVLQINGGLQSLAERLRDQEDLAVVRSGLMLSVEPHHPESA